MDWFRWHHGSVNDPKFQLVAKKAGCSVAEVIAVWASLLEAASMAEMRGNIGNTDFEAMDCALGLLDGRSAEIVLEMEGRGLLGNGVIASWDRRQVKREREDNSGERVKVFRERQNHVTPCNANDAQETPRLDKRREEVKTLSPVAGFEMFWFLYPRKKSKGAAEKVWAKIKPNEQLQALICDGVRRAKTSADWKKDDGKFIPYPASWLNDKGWEDGLIAVSALGWWRNAGFDTEFDARNAGCFDHNAAQFQNGKRLEPA